MSTATTLHGPLPALLAWLKAHDIAAHVHEHPASYTAMGTAIAECVDPRTFAKVVGIMTHERRPALAVLDAPDHLDVRKAARTLSTASVRLLTEAELADLAPDCPVGTIPAVGALFGVPVIADHAIARDAEISFNAGSHRFSVRVDRLAWERAADVVYGDIAVTTDDLPAWARS
jgi:Ala-tRNA(Pro) deacylase